MTKLTLTITISFLSVTLYAQNNVANPASNKAATTTGTNNTSIGQGTGASNTEGSGNTNIGVAAGGSAIDVDGNVAIGDSAGFNNTNELNIFIGKMAGFYNTGKRNVIIGQSAAKEKLEDNDNVFIGFEAGLESDKAKRNVVIGSESGQEMDDAEDYTFVGSESGKNTDANNNSFFGRKAGKENVKGYDNTFLGKSAGEENTDGIRNTYMGYRAGMSGSTLDNVNYASYNVAVGDSSGAQNQGDGNVFIGSQSGYSSISAFGNVFLGEFAAASGPDASSISNSAAIGSYAKVAISNAIVLGDTSNTDLKVGIGTASPKYKLDVKGVVNMCVTSNSPAIKINGEQFAGLDQNGNFLLSDFKIRYNKEEQWSDKVFEKAYPLMPLKNLKSYIEDHKHLPNIPSASEVVNEGIGIHEITAKLLEKIEEQALYIIQLMEEVDKLKEKVK